MRINRRRGVIALAIGAIAATIGIAGALDDGKSSRDGFDAADLPLRQLAGQRIVSGFSGQDPPPALRSMIRRGELAGVVLFSANFDDRAEAARLNHRLQRIRRPRGLRGPLLVMVDQEGGQVKRLSGPPSASAAQMGARGPGFSRRQGAATGKSLSGAGFNVDLAPVLDVGRPGGAISEEGRSFGSSATTVSAAGVAFARGVAAGGAAATAKHFPGLGAADVNTDFGVEQIGLSKSTLRATDEAPFETFTKARGQLVMMSSAIYPAFSQHPAVFARALATGELRGRLGFEGVSVSDALQSAAAQAFGGPARVARAAARAGTDLLLFTDLGQAAQAGDALRRALHDRDLRRAGFEPSVQRVLDLRADLAG
jgi:beta-N-acetylhexosaminidase